MASSFGLRPTQLAIDVQSHRKPNEKEPAKPASRYSYPQLAFKLPTLVPGQNSIGTGDQYSIGADTGAGCERRMTFDGKVSNVRRHDANCVMVCTLEMDLAAYFTSNPSVRNSDWSVY